MNKSVRCIELTVPYNKDLSFHSSDWFVYRKALKSLQESFNNLTGVFLHLRISDRSSDRYVSKELRKKGYHFAYLEMELRDNLNVSNNTIASVRKHAHSYSYKRLLHIEEVVSLLLELGLPTKELANISKSLTTVTNITLEHIETFHI